MVTKAIIEEILENGKQARVRIPIYNKASNSPSATPFDELYIATICNNAGVMPALRVGDVVFVAFENGELREPVIIGLLFKDDIKSTSNIETNSLIVNVNTKLSADTSIGNTNATDIKNLAGTTGNIQQQINLLGDKIAAGGGGGESGNVDDVLVDNISVVVNKKAYISSDGMGAVKDIKIGDTSILSNKVATIVTNSTYNSLTNKIATMEDITNAISNAIGGSY